MVRETETIFKKLPFAKAVDLLPFPNDVFEPGSEQKFPYLTFRIGVTVWKDETVRGVVTFGITSIKVGNCKLNLLPFLIRSKEVEFEKICRQILKSKSEYSSKTVYGQ